MKINLENKQDFGASTLRQITHMPKTNLKRIAANTTFHCVAFVDYEKAFDSVHTQAILTSLQFDSVHTQAILTSLQEQGIEDVYIEILKDIYGQLSDSASAQRVRKSGSREE